MLDLVLDFLLLVADFVVFGLFPARLALFSATNFFVAAFCALLRAI